MFDTAENRSPLYYEIIRQLYYGKVLSCTDLSERTSKSIPLITTAINALIKSGFVEKKGYAPSSGGRRPLMYALKQDRLYVVTIAMDQLSARIGIVDMQNHYVSGVEVVELRLLNNPLALDTLVQAISNHIDQSGIPRSKIIGAGIGMPGLVNAIDGINYSYLPVTGKSLSHYLSDALGLKVFIDNDSSLIALAEHRFGKAHDFRNVMVINMGWGIGLGMIINGQLYRGDDGFAGEFSHIPISEKGSLCYCGKQGCLESEASLLAVADKALQGISKGRLSRLAFLTDQNQLVIGNALMDLANQGDQYAIELFMEAAYKIGRGLSILIHINNPKAIILSGRGAKVGKLVTAPIQQAITSYCIPRLANNTELLVSDFGYEAELIGAAILVMEHFSRNTFATSANTARKISKKLPDPQS